MGPSQYRRLDGVINEATLHDAEIDPESRTARLRLGVLLHATRPDDSQPERTLVLSEVSRATVWLRRVRREPGPPHHDGPPILLRDAIEITSWMRRWSGCHLYDQPAEIFDAGTAPAWLSRPSADLEWPLADTPRRHTLDLTLRDHRGPGGHAYMLDARLAFGRLDVLNDAGDSHDIDELADAVAAWWHDMNAGHTGGRYGIYPGDRPAQ